MDRLEEADFIDGLKKGAMRTRMFMDSLTDYHGGAASTEYVLTVDIARAFLEEQGRHIGVEVLNRHFCNTFTATDAKLAKARLKSKRTDIIIGRSLEPDAIVEVKIRIKTFRGLMEDIDKLTTTINFMKENRRRYIIAASVFQINIQKTKKRVARDEFLAAATAVEKRIKCELRKYGDTKQAFRFEMKDLQDSPADGVIEHGIEIDDNGQTGMGVSGHVTRYYAIIIKHEDYVRRLRSTQTSGPDVVR